MQAHHNEVKYPYTKRKDFSLEVKRAIYTVFKIQPVKT